MKLILLLLTSLLLNIANADIFSLPDNAFSVNVATGKWVETAVEGETRRAWDGDKWQWQGNKNSSIYKIDKNQLQIVYRPGLFPISYSYDSKGKIIKRTEGFHFIELTYDDKGRVIEQRAPVGKTNASTTYARYVYQKKATEVYDALGNKKVYFYNNAHEVIQIDHYLDSALYKTEKFKWENGQLKRQSLEDREGKELLSQKNIWDSKGRLSEQIISGNLTGRGSNETFTQSLHYNKQGAVEKVKFNDGSEILAPKTTVKQDKNIYLYNSFHQLSSLTFPNGESESYFYDSYGNLTGRTTTKDGKTERFTYDFMNRLIRESDGFSFEYDAASRQVKQIDPEGNETEFKYDSLGRVIEKIEPEVLSPSGKTIRPTSKWVYNELDQVVEMTDADGWTTTYTYTVRGDPVKITHPDGTVEEQYYQLNGQKEGEPLPAATPVEPPLEPAPEENTEKFLPQPDVEDPTITERVYNERGQKVIQKTFVDFIGIKSVRTFDALGRLEKVERFDLLGNRFQIKEIRYTPSGKKALEITDGETIEWVWGPMGRLDAILHEKVAGSPEKTGFLYDKNNRLSHMIKPSGLVIGYTYDEVGGLKTLRSSDNKIHYHFTWNSEGRLASAEDINTGKTTIRSYDEKGVLIQEVLANGLSMAWENDATRLPDGSRIRYQRDENGILKGISRENPHGTTLYTHTYTQFDAYDHLIEEAMILGMGKTVYKRDNEQRIIGISSPFREEKITYDGLKLTELEIDGKKTTFEYDAQFRLVKSEKDSHGPVEWDKDGNTLQSSGHKLRYDPLGRLIEVDGLYHYEYDAFDRRIKSEGPEGVRLHLWDGMEEIGIASTDGRIEQLKVMGSHGPVAVELDGTPYPALLDAKGSIAKLACLSGESPESPWTYQGKRLDPESGFIYFGSRFLDPLRGQFLTPDPRGFADGQDLYHFAKYNPNHFSDTWGHTAIMDGFKSLVKTGWNALLRLNQTVSEWRNWLANLSGMKSVQNKLEDAAFAVLGKGFLIQTGYYKQEIQTGIFGDKEYDPLVRVTFNHGILNIRSDLIENLREISAAHGGINVHYVYRPTSGFAWDLMKCLLVKCGYLSQEAQELIRIWKGLIEEMGGTNSGGKIIHYTHSVGGTDTYAALSHMTVEEQRMLDIRTFGSATVIPDRGTYTIMNYVSKRDGVTLFADPLSFFGNILKPSSSVVYVGTLLGFPFVDHPFASESYQLVLRALGQAFLETYSG